MRRSSKKSASPPIDYTSASSDEFWALFLKSQDLPYLPSFKTTASTPVAKEESELSEEQKTLIDRVVAKITSSPTDPSLKAPLHIREKFRRELTEVFLGKRNFNDWFEQTRKDLNIHMYDLARAFYDSLEGLKSPEARKLREEYFALLQQIAKAYTP